MAPLTPGFFRMPLFAVAAILVVLAEEVVTGLVMMEDLPASTTRVRVDRLSAILNARGLDDSITAQLKKVFCIQVLDAMGKYVLV